LAAGVLVIGIEATIRYVHRRRADVVAEPAPEGGRPARPFALWPALLLAALLTAVTLAARWAADVAGPSGTIAAAALAGFADAHAPTLAVATLAAGGSVSLHTAVTASGLALATNTVSKCALAAAAGGKAFGASFLALVVLPVGAVAAGLTAAQFAS
jgi:uncharacterized membrane protein (DUF4010 family)